jgi:hypothetical protein
MYKVTYHVAGVGQVTRMDDLPLSIAFDVADDLHRENFALLGKCPSVKIASKLTDWTVEYYTWSVVGWEIGKLEYYAKLESMRNQPKNENCN